MKKQLILFALALLMVVSILPMFVVETEAATTYNWLFPVNNGGVKVAYVYGYSSKYFDGEVFHTGIDIHSSGDQVIYAAFSGTVTKTPNSCSHVSCGYQCAHSSDYGNSVWIKSDDGLTAIYGHLKQFSHLVEVGDKVEQGQPLASMGSSGWSDGKHLHFEVRKNGKTINVTPANSKTNPGVVSYSTTGYQYKVSDAITEGTYKINNDGYRIYTVNDKSAKGTLRVSASTVDSKFEIKIVKDGNYYRMYPASGGSNYFNAFWNDSQTSHALNGTEVTLCKNDKSDYSQKWIFERYGKGYLIHPACTPGFSLTRDGEKIILKKTTYSANQIWTLETEVGCSHEYVYAHENCEWTNPCNLHWQECTKCGDKRESKSHNWSPYYLDNGGILSLQSGHVSVCNKCGLEGLREHVYDHSCDAFCNVCNRERSVEHVYDNACDTFCNICDEPRNVQHVYDNSCDAFCNACGEERAVTHSYTSSYQSNAIVHWKTCVICGEEAEKSMHRVYVEYNSEIHWWGCEECSYSEQESHNINYHYNSSGHSVYCDWCNYESATMPHTPSTKYSNDQHWQECPCGYITGKTSHTHLNGKDSTGHWTYCAWCNYESATMPHTLTTKYSNDQHWQECPCGYTTAKTDHSINYYIEDMEHIGKCVACNYTTAPEVHDVDCFSTAQGHWWECSICDYVSEVKPHALADKFDNHGHWQFCTACNYQGMKTEHTFIDKNDDDHHWKECDCGYSTGKTSHTHLNGKDSTGHWTYCAWCNYESATMPHTPSTKYSNNQHWQECSCGYTTEKISHTFTNRYDANRHWQECSCGYIIDKINHSLLTEKNTTEHWQYCSSCDYKTQSTSHKLVTNYSGSQHWQECSCGFATAKMDHSLEYTYTEYSEHIGECTICGYASAPMQHDVDLFFTAQGHWWECCICDYISQVKPHTMIEEIDAEGHWQFCSVCNYEIMITEHTFNNKNDDSDHWKECACGYSTEKTSHTLVIDANSAGHWFCCVNCDYKRSPEAHTLDTEVITKDASCTQEGEMKLLCSVCGHEEHSIIPKTDHNYTTTVSDGYKHFVCTTCKYTYEEPVSDIPSTDECINHSYGEWLTVKNATCQSTGEMQQVCSNCGHSNVKVTEKEDHDFGAWFDYGVVENFVLERRDCKNCDTYETRETDSPVSKDHQDETLGDYLISGCSGSLRFSVLSLFAILTLTGIALFKKKHI